MVHLIAMQISVHMPLAELQHDGHDSLCNLSVSVSLCCKHLLYLNNVIIQEMANSM